MIISGWGPRAAPANGEAKPVEGGMRGVCAPDSARPTSGARGVRSDPERSAKVYARAPRSPLDRRVSSLRFSVKLLYGLVWRIYSQA